MPPSLLYNYEYMDRRQNSSSNISQNNSVTSRAKSGILLFFGQNREILLIQKHTQYFDLHDFII